MAAIGGNTVSTLKIEFQKQGDTAVTSAFKKLSREANGLQRNFKTLSDKGIRQVKAGFDSLRQGSANSIQSMRAQKNALMGLRDMADVTGLEFKQLTADIARLDAKMRSASAGTTGFKGRLKGFAKGAGAVAAGGIFGGAEGAVGAGLGLALSGGNPAGAAVGAAVGAQVGMVRQQLAGVAEYSAALGLQRKALKLVIGDTNKFNKSQEFLRKTSKELAIPQDVITRQFTALTASVVGAGQSVSDAEEVFAAIAAGIRGTGGTLEDMKAAMRATSQVFSKGKVSAEELRQQLGERLPGAFTLFADSMDKTPAELDKALEQGKVTLDDFMKFAKTLFATYGDNAKILAQGPEAAGDRLKTEMSELKDNVGKLLQPIGAEFQTTFSEIVKSINPAIAALTKFQNKLAIQGIQKQIKDIKDLQSKNKTIKIGGPSGRFFGSDISIVKADTEAIKKQTIELIKLEQKLLDLKGVAKTQGVGPLADSISYLRSLVTKSKPTEEAGDPELNNIEKGAKAYFDTIGDFAKQTQDAVAGAFKGMEDALVKFVQTGKLNFSDLARSIMADLTRMLVRASLLNFLSPFPFFDRITGGSANGNAFAKNGIIPYRNGGVVGSPTMFKYGGSNLGIMGEAGPEAILPLQRGKGGKLGVQSSGGVGNIVVNVDASGSSVQGDSAQSQEFGRALASAIQSEMLKQKRPGGLLT